MKKDVLKFLLEIIFSGLIIVAVFYACAKLGPTPPSPYTTITLDGCQYLQVNNNNLKSYGTLTHKGNCSNVTHTLNKNKP